VPTTLHHRVTAAALTLLVVLVGALASAGSASAETAAFRAFDKRGKVFYFKVDGVSPKRIKYATVSVSGEHWMASKRRVRRGVKTSNVVRARTPRRVHERLLRQVSAAARKPSAAKLRIRIRHKKSSQAPGTTGDGAGNGPLTNPVSNHNAACDAGLGSFAPGRWPSACWRPYSDDSPFNRRLPSAPRVADNSDQVVNRMTGFGPPENIVAGTKGDMDFSKPVYWSQPNDPWYTVHCVEDWGRCKIEGDRIQIPEEARAATGEDGHMTVVDQSSGWEYDMWQVKSKPKGGGTITTSWGGKTRIDGDGLGSDAVAAQFGTMAGKIRVEELEAGKIDHALFISVNCDSGKWVYPATKPGRSCSSIGESNANAPAMGTRFQLDMSEAQINALDVPDWKKTILRAMSEYGMYVGDTGNSWAVQIEGGVSYTAMGYPDPWVKFAKKVGAPYYAPDDDYVFNLRDGVNWKNHLRVVEPCEAQGNCS
jgi:hypothetical protein